MNLGSLQLMRGAGCGGHRKVASFQSMFLQAAVHGAAAQSQSLGCLADVSFVACKSTLNQIALNFVEAHLLQLSCSTSSLCAQTEVCRADGWAGRKEYAAFHGVIQFADVARPGMFMKRLDSRRVESGNIFTVALRVAVEKMVRKEINILAAVAQRRNVNLDGIQPKEKVLTEPPGRGLGIHVGIRSREHSDVHAPSGGRAYALEIACFQNAQKFRLQVKRNIGDFVQEHRPAAHYFDPPPPLDAPTRQ